MAEDNLEGMEDLDSLLEDGGGEGGEESFAGELDDFLGDDAGADAGAGGEEEGGGDSELDSFFEDLSTIDDLEVIQDEESPPEPEGQPEPAPEAPMEAPVAAAAVAAAAPAAAAAAKKRRSPFLRRMVVWLILLGAFGGGGYWVYNYFFPDGEPPWEQVEKVKSLVGRGPEKLRQIFEEDPDAVKPPAKAPEPPPPVPRAAPPPPRPKDTTPPPGARAYGVQVASCFFSSCLDGFRNTLKRRGRKVYLRERKANNQSLEILSRSAYPSRETATEIAERINREHRMEGQAYVVKGRDGYRISMGTFPDLSRANVVKDSLNQQFPAEVVFTTQLRQAPFKLQRVIAGRYATRAEARRELRALKRADRRFQGAFVVRYR